MTYTQRKLPHPIIKNGVACTTVCGESCSCLPRSVLPAYALRSAVGTLSLSTSVTEQRHGLLSCTFVGKLIGLVCVMNVDNELLRVSVEAVAVAALKCVLCLCLCRTASERN